MHVQFAGALIIPKVAVRFTVIGQHILHFMLLRSFQKSYPSAGASKIMHDIDFRHICQSSFYAHVQINYVLKLLSMRLPTWQPLGQEQQSPDSNP